jgi:hypothetical protein
MKTATYQEDGWVAIVLILKDESDSEWERYELEVIETIREPWMHDTPKNGHVFSPEQKRSYARVFNISNIK